LGINQGDRVGIYLPMVPEAAVAILATARVGAVFTPIFSGYGAQALATRLADAGAKLLFTADGFYRRGQRVEMKRTADEAAALCPELRHVVVVRRGGWEVPWTEGRDVAWDDLLAGRSETGAPAPTGSEDPFLLIYTSGTTGRPKGTVHVHGGFPLKCVQDIAHCFDLHAGETLFWVTDMGWVMGPWEVIGALTLGATCLLYDGTPDFPAPDRLWSLVERHRVNVLGLSPTAIRSLMTQGEDWVRRHDLSSLHTIGGTGAPWNPEPWYWYFRHVGGGRCPMINYSGGTEIGGGIVGCVPLKPIKPCGFTGPIPGMDAEVVDEDGRPVRGSVGELVIRQPWPGMTRGFWQDRDRYLSTYWSRWPDVWVHGDWALVDEDGFWFIQGRSDDTLKVAGKRLGPAEVESALVSHPAVAEAAAIGVPHEVKGEV
ncbi:MAG: AMP-binding protein, partial [Clostridia bacterium]|nr:AMP-binding protein [Clostridia bacterium]